nr:reverse transcriptase domain-containing protein [Tanacetum cinerariifolium]
MTPITAPWPFYKWGIDIAGPFPEGPGKVKFLIVAMDYFPKWIEAKAVATITGGQVIVGGKLRPKWEGPYEVTDALGNGSYKLRSTDGTVLPRTWNVTNLPMDVIMAALYLESDTRGDALQFIRDLRPSSSQLAIPVYPEVRDPRNPWAYKEEIKLSVAITANISRTEKKKKCRIACRTHGVGSAHHARSDSVPVSVPTVVPQGLTLLLVDAATQTGLEDA